MEKENEQYIDISEKGVNVEDDNQSSQPNDNASNFEYVSIIPEEKDAKFIEIFSSPSVFKYFLGALVLFGVCFISFIFVFQILMTHIGVIGYSMTPTINASAIGDKGDINTDSVYYMNCESYEYKDIVIIKGGKTDSGDMLIKRVIATPGQTITFKKINRKITSGETRYYYEVYVDEQLLIEDYILDTENYLRKMTLDSAKYQYFNFLVNEIITTGEFSQTLGENQYFIMGDNRNNSIDSRWFGPVEKEFILGKVVIQIKYGDSLLISIFKSLFSAKLNYLYIKP